MMNNESTPCSSELQTYNQSTPFTISNWLFPVGKLTVECVVFLDKLVAFFDHFEVAFRTSSNRPHSMVFWTPDRAPQSTNLATGLPTGFTDSKRL